MVQTALIQVRGAMAFYQEASKMSHGKRKSQDF
jgi:hypothetical protein